MGATYSKSRKPATVRRNPSARRRDRLPIAEAYTGKFTKPLKVDRKAGVIFGVKALGWHSANKREYTKECAEKAIRAKLYEGVKVRINHRAKPGEVRDLRDSFGKLCNARIEEDGIYADLHFLTTHDLAESVCEDAEKGLGVYGLSHDAEAAEYEIREGIQVILELASISSVDIVDDAATNSSLSESRKIPTRIKVSALLEQLAADSRLSKAQRRKLLEMDDYDGPAEMDEPAAGASPREALADAVAAMLKSEDAADHELAQKVQKLLKPEAAVPEDDDEEGDEDDEVKEGDEEGDEDDEVKEGDEDDDKPKERKGKTARKPARGPVLTEARAKALLDLAGVKADKDVLEAVQGCATEAAAYAVIKLAKGRGTGSQQHTGGPRSSSGVGVQEQRGGDRAPQSFAEVTKLITK